jgi:hypothetical protein
MSKFFLREMPGKADVGVASGEAQGNGRFLKCPTMRA